MKRLILFLLSICIALTCVSHIEARALLGIGLNLNIYDSAEDVKALGNPWVYNWTFTPYGGYKSSNNPVADFGKNFVPMQWAGCSSALLVQNPAAQLAKLENWIKTNNYTGPLLFLNEPDHADQANCTPENGAKLLKSFLDWKHANNIAVDVFFGGVYDQGEFYTKKITPPPCQGICYTYEKHYWMDDFIAEWNKIDSNKPDIAGIHFHVYPEMEGVSTYGANDIPAIIVREKALINYWDTWLRKPENAWAHKRAWVTEYGILWGGYMQPGCTNPDPSKCNTYDIITVRMQKMGELFAAMTDTINTYPWIERAAWFGYENSFHYEVDANKIRHEYPSNYMSGMGPTFLVQYLWNGQSGYPDTKKLPPYTTFQQYCLTRGYCQGDLGVNPTPTGNPINSPTPIISGITPTSNPIPTNTPIPTATPTDVLPRPTLYPSPTPTLTPLPSPTVTGIPTNNLIKNSDFETNNGDWNIKGSKSKVSFVVTQPGYLNKSSGLITFNKKATIRFVSNAFVLEAQKQYKISFALKSNTPSKIKVSLRNSSGTNLKYIDKNLSAGVNWTVYNYTVVPTISTTISDAQLRFDLDKNAAGTKFQIDAVNVSK